jgi:cysteinyl-tRNA synthetase
LSREGAGQIKNLLMDFDRILGVFEGYRKRKAEKLPEEIEALIGKREEARRAGDWETADAIRSKLRRMGIVLEDTPEGVRWKKVPS